MKSNGQPPLPTYPDNASSTPKWAEEADRSQGWAIEARAAARRRQRRQRVYLWLLLIVFLVLCAAIVVLIAYTIAKAT